MHNIEKLNELLTLAEKTLHWPQFSDLHNRAIAGIKSLSKAPFFDPEAPPVEPQPTLPHIERKL